MGHLINWLLHDDRKSVYDIVFAIVQNIVFLGLTALPSWLLGKLGLISILAKGYVALWLCTTVVFVLVKLIHRLLRINSYDRAGAFLLSNLAVSCALQLGWAALAALAVHGFVTGAPTGTTVLLYLFGACACIVAFQDVSAFYTGQIYRFISLPIALLSFTLFSIWPIGARTLFRGFFGMF